MTATGTITDYIMPETVKFPWQKTSAADLEKFASLDPETGKVDLLIKPLHSQEIRARALECAVRWLSSRTDALEAVGVTDEQIKKLFWGFAKDFEVYIKGD